MSDSLDNQLLEYILLKKIIKRDGSEENFTPIKAMRWAAWGSENLGERVNWSEIVRDAVATSAEVVSSQDFQLNLIKQCAMRQDWAHNLMAGKLYSVYIHKKTYPNGIPSVKEQFEKMIALGYMVDMGYSDEELHQMQSLIDHNKDYTYAYFQVEHIYKKYGLQNRVAKEILETPQFTFMRMAARINMNKKDRMKNLPIFYEKLSSNSINAPTPNYLNLGTPHNGLASCCLYTTDDTIASLNAGNTIAYVMTAQSAGIGGFINTRSLGDPVRGGSILHQGKLPYYKNIAGEVTANIQAGRGGACTQYYSAYDPDAMTIAMLQNEMSPDNKRNRDIHFAVCTNKWLAKKVAAKESVFSFNVYTAPDLMKAFFSGDSDRFEQVYKQYEADTSFKKIYTSAVDLITMFYNQHSEVGTHYEFKIDEANRHTPFLDPIHSSNLCVAPETPVLTKEYGYKTIFELENEFVHVWNGDKWSKTQIKKTSDGQNVWQVAFKGNPHIDVTPYHKFYIQHDYPNSKNDNVIIKRTHELQPGDKILKVDLGIIDHGDDQLQYAYESGFYTGDGCLVNNKVQRVYLYNDKKLLLNKFNISNVNCRVYQNENSDRIQIEYTENQLLDKFKIPKNNINLKHRLDWFAGLLDSDGCITDNNGSKSLQLVSIKYNFLVKLKLFLQELGVNSYISDAMDAGIRKMPDGKGDLADYFCKKTWRILISNVGIIKLNQLGLITHRLDLTNIEEGNRKASRYITVESISNYGRITPTYCFTESEKNMGVFAGIITGNCTEITEPTAPYENVFDLSCDYDPGYIEFEYTTQFDNEPSAVTTVKLDYTSKVHVLGSYPKQAGFLKVGDIIVDQEDLQQHTVTQIHKVKVSPEVAMCSLGGVNVANDYTDAEYEENCYQSLIMIDECILSSDYPLKHIGYTAKKRMNAAVGLIGVATYMAKRNLKYSSKKGKEELHRLAERHAYFCIKASLRISKERGVAPWMHKTKWPQGWLPIDTYKKTVDEIVKVPLVYDWEALRAEIIENGGIGHSALIAHMPTESSSKGAGVPNSILPVRDLSLKKKDQNLTVDWVAVDSDLIGHQYERAFDISIKDMVECYAVIQKFTDMTTSADIYRDRVRMPNLLQSDLVELFLLTTKYGVKSLYYANSKTSDSNQDEAVDKGCASGACTL